MAEVEDESRSRQVMERGVTQLLFNYLPGRTVDWEDGSAIVQLTHVRLGSFWDDSRSEMVRREVSAYCRRWMDRGGTIAPNFPDPLQHGERVAIGEPVAIEAVTFESALLCRRCARLVFVRWADLGRKTFRGLVCPSCGTKTLRQFGQVFVHGCGEILPVTEWLPQMPRDDEGRYVVRSRPLRCQSCEDGGIPELPARTERARDMTVSCRVCKGVIADRLTARCPACAQKFVGTVPPEPDGDSASSPVAAVVMRLANYRANEAYYPHTITVLRLDRAVAAAAPREVERLMAMLPADRRSGVPSGGSMRLVELANLVARAEAAGDQDEAERLKAALVDAATRPTSATPAAPPPSPVRVTDAVIKGIEESAALMQTVTLIDATRIATESSSASAAHTDEIARMRARLGMDDLRLAQDLPIITSTFAFTRRAYEPTYDEESLGARGLPTQLRAFYPVDRSAARRLNRPDLAGTVPLLAREAEHEGILFRLNETRVLKWLETNGVIPAARYQSIADVLPLLEAVDRYYDDIWKTTVHKWIYGLIHTLSHSTMRVVSRLAGLERTSVAEYLFSPILAFVVFANGSAGTLGNLESVLRDHQLELLQGVADEGVTCIYDPDCIDRGGACHGCVHSPEISCRAFNHGLSRALLVGGHQPWVASAIDADCLGYW